MARREAGRNERRFLQALQKRGGQVDRVSGERDIAYVHKRDITALRDITATELSPATDNTDRKILRVAFRQAVVYDRMLGGG